MSFELSHSVIRILPNNSRSDANYAALRLRRTAWPLAVREQSLCTMLIGEVSVLRGFHVQMSGNVLNYSDAGDLVF
jgi:hypothetical protein